MGCAYLFLFWPLWEAIGEALIPAHSLSVGLWPNVLIMPAAILFWLGGPSLVFHSFEVAPYSAGATFIVGLFMATHSTLGKPALEGCLLLSLCIPFGLEALRNRLQKHKREVHFGSE
jgi:hypothetical protein